MEKKNLKRAIAKFEELANDEKYEGNRKIINLDAFLKSDIKKKNKKKDHILESTPIKSNKTDLDKDQLDNTFNEDDSSSSEIKTADEFLKKFISQPSLIESSSSVKNKSSSSVKNKSSSSIKNKSSSSIKNKSSSSIKNKSISPSKSSKNKSTSSIKDNSLIRLKEKYINKSPIKSKKSLSPSKTLNKSNRLDNDSKRYQELKEREQNFLMKFQNANRKTFNDEELDDEELDDEELDDEELDDEELDDEELDDEELDDEELDDEELDDEESKDKPNIQINKLSKAISLLVKSPNSSKKSSPSKKSTMNKQKNQFNKRDNQSDNKLKYYQKLSEKDKQFLLNVQNNREAIDEELSNEDEEFCDEEDINEIENLNDESFDDESIDPENSELFLKEQQHHQQKYHQQHQQQHNQQKYYDQNHQKFVKQYNQKQQSNDDITDEEKFENNKIINLMNKNQYKQICKLNKLNETTNNQSTSSDNYDTIDYITNFEYQKTATEELYELILKSEESSFTVLGKLIKNIKKTLDHDELPKPSNVKPFFHFTPDNQIHITFLFINPEDVYYNPWNSIITKNYSNLNILFEKIYQVIFNFNCILNKKHQNQQRFKTKI